MKYYLIAGEASGDLHASNLMKALKMEDPDAEFRFFGGDLMKAEGGTIVKHYREMAFMGLIPVVMNIRTIARNMRECLSDISRYHPDTVILIDYPGFNLKVAGYVKTKLNIPVCYYISPKIWAWKQYRIKSFRRYVDRMFCILPFEIDFYHNLNYAVEYVGNPCVDAVASFKNEAKAGTNRVQDKPILALLAGSRKQEIRDNLPVMLEVAAAYTDYQPVIAGAPGIDKAYYDKYIKDGNAKTVFDSTYQLLNSSAVALVTSGTATLETALFRVPQVVCYYTPLAKLSGFIFRHFFHTPFISLVNLIAGREVVKELFAEKFSKSNIQTELDRIIHNDKYRAEMLKGYDELINTLGNPGASQRTAISIVRYIQEKVYPLFETK